MERKQAENGCQGAQWRGGRLLYIRLTGGAASLIISEQSPEAREGEPPEDLCSKPNRRHRECKGPGVEGSLVDVRKSKEAGVARAEKPKQDMRSEKQRGPDPVEPCGPGLEA